MSLATASGNPMVRSGINPGADSERSLADDIALISEFAEAAREERSLLRANSNFRVETNFGSLQMFAAREGLIATVKFQAKPQVLQLRENFAARELMHQILVAADWLPIAGCPTSGFCHYQWRSAPEGFVHRGGVAIDLWRTWLRRGGRGSSRSGFGGEVKLLHRGTWYPVQNIAANNGVIAIKSLGPETNVSPETLVVWIEKQG
jgi:hypothetical protein